MLESPQMRAPLKRWLALAGVVIASTTALAWSFSYLHHSKKIDGVSAPLKRGSAAAGSESNSNSSKRTELIDSDNDGIPDVIELRTFQDRDSVCRNAILSTERSMEG